MDKPQVKQNIPLVPQQPQQVQNQQQQIPMQPQQQQIPLQNQQQPMQQPMQQGLQVQQQQQIQMVHNPQMQQQPQMMVQQPQMMVNPGLQPQPQVMYQQQPGVIVQQPQVVYVQQVDMRTGYQKLLGGTGIFIKQQMNALEVVTGCEIENRYNIYYMTRDGATAVGYPFFQAVEQSGCCERNFLMGSCRPFEINIRHKQQGPNDNKPFLRLVRECACTFLCLNRPFMDCFLVENGQNVHIGQIKVPFTCCEILFEIFDKSDQLKFKVRGDCCQLGLHCQCPFDSCQVVNFTILNHLDQEIAALDKRNPGCVKAAISDADNFMCEYPKQATGEDRALLMATVIMLDYQYFEDKQQQNQNQYHGHY